MSFQKKIAPILGKILLLVLLAIVFPQATSQASEFRQDNSPPSASELITAVNNLRLSHGLNALNSHPVLMQVAQSQAEALAATGGSIGHARPGGINLEQQMLMLGYPLSGDLTLGGYRSENFAVGRPGSTVPEIIQLWLGDAPHTNTMLAEHRSDIGAAVTAGADGQIYYVIETALQTTSGQQQVNAGPTLTAIAANQGGASGVSGAEILAQSQYIVPVSMSTARPDGDVIHEVKQGQSLWSIAIAYGTKIDTISRYNRLSDTILYTGQILLIARQATQPAGDKLAETGADAIAETTVTPFTNPTPRPKSPTPAITQTPKPETSAEAGQSSPVIFWLKIIGQVILLVLVMHGLITWLSRRQMRANQDR